MEPRFGPPCQRTLLADTGAGSLSSPFDLILSDLDCRQFGRYQRGRARLGGALQGIFPMVSLLVEVSGLGVRRIATAVAVPALQLPADSAGIVGFRFLNGFGYGNFGVPTQFGLETS